MKTRLQRKIGVVVLSVLLLCSIPASCLASESGTKASASENYYPYIISTLPVDGYVKKLIVPKSSPNYLFALADCDGTCKASDKTGLYVFDVSEGTKAKQILYLPAVRPIGMELSPDGQTLFVYAYNDREHPERRQGVLALDISNARAIRQVWQLDINITGARLSVDGSLLFVKEMAPMQNNKPTFEVPLSIYRVSPVNKPTLLSRAERKYFDDIFPTPDGRHLILRDWENFIVYDITDPSTPREMSQLSRRLGFPKEFGKDGGLYLLYGDDLHYISEHNKTAYISTIDKTIQVIDLTDETAPKVTAQYATPNYVGSVTPARYDKLIYVGLLGSIVVIDPAKAILTSESLIKAHAEALRLYQSKKKKYDFKPIRNAIHLLKAAGIDQALEKKPSGISDRALAGILNDYGFFLTKGHRDNEAINMYKRAIQLDPGRAIAYLNLGDSLRNQLSGVGAFNEKIELTKEIKLAYLQYKKLTRKSTPEIDSFLTLNVVDTPITDFCEYVAAYANQGRLRELFGSGESVKRGAEQGSMRVEISYQGSGRYPHVNFFDDETNQEIDEEIPDNGRDAPWADEIDIVPFLDGHHLLHHTGNYLVISAPIGLAADTGRSCGFGVQATESFDKKGKDTELCGLVLSSKRPSFISFHKSNYLDDEAIKAAGYPPGWAQEYAAGNVDFDNDGKTETLVQIKYSSTAGPGCGYDFFDLLNDGKNGCSSSKRRSLLLEMQGVKQGARGLHPVPHCRENVTGWFRYKGITYFETKYPEDQPRNPHQEFHTISYIKDGKIHKVCEARFKLKIEAGQRHEETRKRERESETELSENDKLLQAAGNGHLEAVKTLLAKGGDVNAKWEDGRTVLMQAVLSTNLELVRFLLDKGADINARDSSGMTALLYATRLGNLETTKLFIDKGADLNAETTEGYTALMTAAASRNPEVVKFLIDKGLDVNAKTVDEDGRTVLMYAAKSGNLEVVRLLIDKGADANANWHFGETPLMAAVSGRNLEVVKLLVDKGADVNVKDKSGDAVLMTAAKSRNLEVVKFLIERGADVNSYDKEGRTVLMEAVRSGNLDLAKLLIDEGADMNARDNKGLAVLMSPQDWSNLEVARLLINKGLDLHAKDKDGRTLLMDAARSGNLDFVKHLIDIGLDLNAKNKKGRTVLMYAVRGGNLDVVKLLIDKGADVNAKDENGRTVWSGNLEVLQFLMDKGLDVNAKDNDGRTNLMAAVWASLDVVKFLINKGLDVNAKDSNGRTVLMEAASSGNLEIVKFLIDKGLEVDAQDDNGRTVLMCAVRSGNRNFEIVRLLVDKGADVNAKTQNGRTALMEADILDIVKFLIDKGADVNVKDKNGRTALMEAARFGNLKVVKFLIDKGLDVNAKDKNGQTALSLVSRTVHDSYSDRFKIVQHLKAHGAKPSDEPPPLPPIEEIEPREDEK